MVATTKVDEKTGVALGTGRRKSSVARVRIKAGSGQITINDRALDDFFNHVQDQRALTDALAAAGCQDKVDVDINVSGGGTTGQAGACRMGIARALVSFDNSTFQALRDGGFLTRDARMKERKKARSSRCPSRYPVLETIVSATRQDCFRFVEAAQSFRFPKMQAGFDAGKVHLRFAAFILNEIARFWIISSIPLRVDPCQTTPNRLNLALNYFAHLAIAKCHRK